MMNKRKLFLGGFLAVIVILSFVYLPVYANNEDEDNDGVNDSYEEENKREVEIVYSYNEVIIDSSLTTGEDIENEFQIELKTSGDGLDINLEYEEGFDTNETEIEFEIRITKIVEYRDLDANGKYNDTNDETVQELLLENFNPIEYTIETINNETVHVLSVETVDEIFSATLYVTGKFANINGVVVAPTQIKVDIGIQNFNYTEDDSILALEVELESEVEVEYDEEDETEDENQGRSDFEENEIEISIGEYSGFFSWIDTAIVDGIEVEVKSSPLQIDEGDTWLYLNYPRGDIIIHDPKIGLAGVLKLPEGFLGSDFWFELPIVSRNELLIVSAISLFIITGLVLVFRRRRTA
ncbi:MAG: hypothetical protein GPJ51_09900 [Candidatus Heimdallarchaeota archaeon]|nr:hypothetical protein [Candidatus Heimdallarchaeota archaeon]